MKRNFPFFSGMKASEGVVTGKGLLKSESARSYGISGGFKFLKANLKLFGIDSDVDILASLVTHATVEYLTSTLLNDGSLKGHRTILSGCKFVLDMYEDMPKCFEGNYSCTRNACLFYLAVLNREENNIVCSIELLRARIELARGKGFSDVPKTAPLGGAD